MNEGKVNRRMTKQRRLILDVLRSTDTHPTANWIYDQVRRHIPNISLGTVYRNLNVLQEMGEIMELSYGAGYSRFDGNPRNHYHFECHGCGRVLDVDLPLQIELEEEVERKLDCRLDEHRIEFTGICRRCLRGNGEE